MEVGRSLLALAPVAVGAAVRASQESVLAAASSQKQAAAAAECV